MSIVGHTMFGNRDFKCGHRCKLVFSGVFWSFNEYCAINSFLLDLLDSQQSHSLINTLISSQLKILEGFFKFSQNQHFGHTMFANIAPEMI